MSRAQILTSACSRRYDSDDFGGKMDLSDVQWLFTTIGGILSGYALAIVGGFKWVLTAIRKVDESAQQRDQDLHSRVTKVQTETVHKSDLQELDRTFRNHMVGMRKEATECSRSTNDRLDRLMEMLLDWHKKDSRDEEGGKG